MPLTLTAKQALEKALERKGLRSTRQREHVFSILLAQRDHPTVEEVYVRAKEKDGGDFFSYGLQLSGDPRELRSGETSQY